MKYVVILCDGAADYPFPGLDSKTPLEKAHTPNIDRMAPYSELGTVKTIPDHLPPGSDVANLSVMGYDPEKHYTGRSPLEAVSMGIDLGPDDLAFRCNLVTLSEEEDYAQKVMIDYSSDEIPSDEAKEVIKEVNRRFQNEEIVFHPGISYRHCMVWKNGPKGFTFTPPHDILEKKVGSYLPSGENSKRILDMMMKSNRFLPDFHINVERRERRLRPANSIWIWGEGKKPSLPSFHEKYNLKGSVISAVDLIKGIGICAGMRSIDVEGTTGNIHTNFRGKALAVLDELAKGQDFVYIHIEAPDECGHRYEIENKVKSIEIIDRDVVGIIKEGLEKYDEYKIMILPDHPTPLSLRTHTHDPVPFMIYHKGKGNGCTCSSNCSSFSRYTEAEAAKSSLKFGHGYELMDYFIKG